MIFVSECYGELIFVTVLPPDGNGESEEKVRQVYSELFDFLKSRKADLLHERVYGSVSLSDTVLKVRRELLSQNGTIKRIPPTYVEGTPFNGAEFAGVHAIAVRSSRPDCTSFLEHEGEVCGSVHHGKEADYLFLSDVGRLLPDAVRKSADEEAHETILLANRILQEIDWSYHNVIRTWFYLDDILGWYPNFNRVRNEVYKRMGLFNGNPRTLIPASTGIWGRNVRGNWCTLDILAMRSQPNHVFQVRRLVNPKQNEATDYGSAFSRGVSVTTDSCQTIFISGTASIDEQGISVYPGDMERQTERTLLNVASLLECAGAQFDRVVQATAFVKRSEDIPVFHRVAERMGLSSIPMVCTIADVCRDDLLFELDATAVLASPQ